MKNLKIDNPDFEIVKHRRIVLSVAQFIELMDDVDLAKQFRLALDASPDMNVLTLMAVARAMRKQYELPLV